MSEFYVEQQYWKHWPKVLVMCRKNGRDVTHRRYVPEVETGEGMGITEELRSWMNELDESGYNAWFDVWMERLQNIADRIDAEHKRKVGCTADEWDYWESTHVELPKDADGEYIRVGERVQLIGNDPGTVTHMSLADDGWRVYVKYDGGIGTGSGEPKRIRHHHAPTVEDVLREMCLEIDRRCERGSIDYDELFAEYAARLQLREDA